jgi:hypothetical protein
VTGKVRSSRLLQVFLCHSSGDKPAVRELYKKLRANGVKPWLDEEDLLPGQDWNLEIPKAVRISDVVIVCISHESVNKAGYIQKEIKLALDVADEQPEGSIFIIPLKLEECDVPERLSRWQWANLFDENCFERLMRALKTRSDELGIELYSRSKDKTEQKRNKQKPIGFIDLEVWQRIKGDLSNKVHHHRAVGDICNLAKNFCPNDGVITDMLRWIEIPMPDSEDPHFSVEEIESLLAALKEFCEKAVIFGQLNETIWPDIKSVVRNIAFDIELPKYTNYNSAAKANAFEIIHILDENNLFNDEDMIVEEATKFIYSVHKKGNATDEYGGNYIKYIVDWLVTHDRKTQICEELKNLERCSIDENIITACEITRNYLRCYI